MKKQDIKENGYYFRLIIIYAIILGIVYSFWMYKTGLPIWSYVLVGVLFLLGGIGLAFLYVQRKASKKAKEEAIEPKQSQEAETSTENN